MMDGAEPRQATSHDAALDWVGRVRIVLIGTSHAGNIGAVARAMKTMGLSRLVLVAPRAEIDDTARANAKHAVDVLEQAEIYDQLDEALAQSIGVWATSARPRGLNLPLSDVRTSVGRMQQTLRETTADGDISILFGAERTGLTNAELLQAQALMAIPANTEYPVLNLAQAVQIVSYELRLAANAGSSDVAPSENADVEPIASNAEVAGLVARLGALLDDRGYFPDAASTDPRARERLLGRVRLLLNRARPSTNELAVLHGMLTTLGRAPDNGD